MFLYCWLCAGCLLADEAGLIGRWELGEAIRFDGRKNSLEIPDRDAMKLGSSDFTIALWAETAKDLDDGLGDFLSKYDPESRRGFQFGLLTSSGVASSQPNFRQVFFGIDDGGHDSGWIDCGRPGNSVYILALAAHDGSLFAGTFESGGDHKGHVYRYGGGEAWLDCGAPDACNAVMSLAAHQGKLYAGAGRYKAGGSALADSPNQQPGGRVYRYEGDQRWADCGRLGEATEAFAMATFKGELYAIPLYSQGVYTYRGGAEWQYRGAPGRRLMALGVFNGDLFTAGNEGNKAGGIYRYGGGERWLFAGGQVGVDQVYSFAAYQGRWYAGTWPEAAVFQYDGGSTWTSAGRLGDEKEVMSMMVYNGQLYAGTLPLAEVYRYEGGTSWKSTGRLDRTPEAKYRRAWSMAIYQGKLFCGTLPSGRVYSFEAGQCVTSDRELPPGKQHLAAVRAGLQLKLYLNGKLAAASTSTATAIDISNRQPLRIGFGAQDYFNGILRDLRIYREALSEEKIQALMIAPLRK